MVLIVLHKSYFFTNIALKLILIKNMACNSITPQIEDLAKRLKVTPQEASNIVSLYQSQTEHKNQFPSVDEAKEYLKRRNTGKIRNDDIVRQLMVHLTASGFTVLGREAMEKFLQEHKIEDLQQAVEELKEMDTIKQKAVADGTFMKAPNGKPTNLTERQWLQVRTTNFKNWFGDWENDPQNASKVVDENGEPKVVYHGSKSSNISVFNPKKSDSRQFLSKSITPTNFFTDDMSVAEFFTITENQRLASAISRSISVVLDALSGENMSSEELDKHIWKEASKATGKSEEFCKDFWNNKVPKEYKMHDEYGNSLMEDPTVEDYKYQVFINMKHPIVLDAKGERADKFIEANRKILDENDEVIIKNIDETVGKENFAIDYLVRKPNNIKSATNNNGNFSLTDDSIQAYIDKDGSYNASINITQNSSGRLGKEDLVDEASYRKAKATLRKSDATQTEIEQAEKTLKDIYARKKSEMQQILNKFAEFSDSEFTIEEAGGSWLGGEEYSFKISIRSKTQEDYNKVLQALSYVAEGLKQDAFIENLGEVNESEVTTGGLLNGDYTPTLHIAFARTPTTREIALIQKEFTDNSIDELPLDATITDKEIVFNFPSWLIDDSLSEEERIKAYKELYNQWASKIENIKIIGKNGRFKDIYQQENRRTYEKSRFHSATSTEGTERDYSGFRNNNFPTTQQQGISEEKGREIRDFSNKVISSRRDSEIQTFTTPQGEVYGFVDKDGNIYLDETKISPEHPIHEYTHVWDRIVAKRNPELWKRGVELMKQTSLWKEISESESYGKLWRKKGITGERLDNLIASEVHARFVGEGGARLLDDIAKKKGQENIISKLRQWILDFWKNLKETFGNWSKSDLDKLTLKDFNHMTVRDFAENTLSNINQTTNSTVQETQEKKFAPEYQLDRSKLEADTRYDQLRKDMSSRTIELRAQHIAKEFADKVMPMLDEAIAVAEEERLRLMKEGPYKNRKELLSLATKIYKLNLIKASEDRIKAIQAIGPETIFKAVKEELQEYADMSEEDFVNETDLDASKQAEYKKFVKNFDALQNYALYYINMREGVKIEEDETDSEEKRIAEGNTGWGFKVRFTDPYTTSSAITKHLLNSLSMLDKNGDVVFDDLGNVITLTGNYAHSALMHELSKIKEPSDFVEYDANGKPSFPALEDMKAKYPWVEQLIGELESNPEIISTVFNDFRQDFISYWVVVKDKKTGKLITKRVNHATAQEAVVPLIEHNFEYGELQSEDSLFAIDRTINKGNISKALDLHKEAKKALKQGTQEGYDTLVSNVTELLKMAGFSIEEADIEAVLNGKDGLEKVGQILTRLSNYLTSLKSYEGTNLIEDYKSEFYNPVADIIGKVNPELTLDSFRDHGKSYYSYSAPNFLNTLIKHLKDMDGDKRRAYMDKHFKQYKWYYDEKTGWKSEWLRAFYEDDGITDRDALDVMNLLAIEGNEYRDWTMGNIMKGFITAYFGANSDDFAWYNTPIFADSPMANLIKMRKIKGKDNADMKKTLLDRFETVVRQELWRMKLVEKRKGKVTPIVNWDVIEKNGKRGKDGGNTFFFFPELNDYVTKEGDTFFEAYNKLAATYAQNQNVTQFQRDLKSLIQTAVSKIMENNYTSFRTDVAKEGVENELKESIVPESMKTQDAKDSYFEDALEEYYWNNAYAQTQIIELTTVDPAFYKNDGGVDFQKRFKEIYAAGSRLNTALPYDEGGRKYERTIYIADDIRISPSYKDIEQGLRKAADEKKFGNDVKMGHAVVDDILFKFRDINSTDGQAYRSLKSFRSVVKMLGRWNDKMEEAYNRFRAGTWEMSDFYVVWNTIKPYVFTIDDVPTGVDETKYGKTMPVPHQNKNSEFLLLAMYGLLAEKAGLSPQMRGINRFMEDYDIDVVQFESAAKVGGQGIVNLNYSRTALAAKGYDSYSKYQDDLYAKLKAGKITQEQFNQAMDDILPSEEEVMQILKDAALKARDDKFIVKDEKTGQTYNAEVVHSHSYDDYMIAQPTPEHLFDTETVFGSQINALITADLPADFSVTINGKTYDKNGIRKFYKSLKVENLLEDFQKIKDRFKSIEDFQKALEETIKDNPKYGREVLDAIQLVPDGQGGKMFNIPLNNPSTTIKLQEVVTSMFKNGVTKQKIKGGANILVSNFGYTNQLKLVYNKEGDVASGIKYAECYMPAWSKKYFKEFMDENGNIDIDKIPDNLKEMVVYRIPTEHKYSMLPIKIVGFLPIQNGSCMMLPMETVAQAGEDFDVDKKFVFMPEFEPPTFKGKKKQQFIEDFIKYKEEQGVKVSKDAVKQAADMIEADIESDEGTLEAEASDFYWDNYKEYGLNQIRKIEYDHTKTPAQNTRAQRNNMLIDIIRGILTSPQVVEQVNHAGNYDHVKKASRLSRIVNDPILVEAYMQEKKIANLDELAEHFLNVDLDTLDDFMKKHKKAFNWLDPRTFMYFHRQNMAGDALIGLYANNSVAHAKYQEFGIGIHGDFQFTINGVRMDSISKMRTADGTLISFNNAEFLAAAPDNAKDPVLADLMQNPNTANLTAAMLRMGMNIQDIGLLFNQPTVKRMIENGTLDSLSDVLKDYMEYVQTFDGAYSLSKTPSVTSKDLLMNILNADSLNKLKDSKKPEEMKQYAEALAKTLPALQVMVNIQRIANDLSTLTNMSRADSTNGAIATTVAQALNQKRKVEVFTKKAAAGKTAITNVEGVIKNGKITADMDIDEMRMRLDDGDVAMLQAFYSLGIEMALPLMARYFPQVSQAVEDIFNIVSDNAPRQMIPQTKSKKTPYSVDQLLKDITTFALSGTKMFGDDGINTYEQKRNYYIYEFPKKFVEILEQNPDLENIATLKKLVVKQGKIQFDNQGKMSTHTRNNLMSELDLLLTSENPVAQELLEDLIKYSYYTEQLNFGPRSFGTFISPKVLNAFPEFAQTLRDIPTIMSRPTAITRFIDQMYAQNVGGMLKTYKDFKKLEDGTVEQSFKGKDAEAPDYLAFLEDHPTLTTEITTIENGKTVKKKVPKKVPVAYKLARSYREESENMTIGVYEKVGLFINSDGIRYNMNMDASDMAKQPFDAKKWAALQSLYGRQQRETEGMRRAEEERAKMWEMDGIDYMEDNDFDIDAQEVEQELDSEPNFDVDAMGDFDAFFAQKEENNTYNIDESIATLDREMC